MALTTYGPTATRQAGNIKVVFGPKITTLTAPSLAAFTVDATCAITQFATTTDVTMTERQNLCDKDAYEWMDRRIRKLDQTVFRASDAEQTAILALLAEDAEVGVFVRPYVDSDEPLAVADKGWAFNARVAKLDPNPIAVENEFEWLVDWYEVTRTLNAVLAA